MIAEGGSDVGEGEVGGVGREVGKGEKSENEKGEWGDTCMVVVASVSSSAALGESASVGRPPSPGGLVYENPVGCVCVVWPYPGWRADASVFSLSWLPACFSSSRCWPSSSPWDVTWEGGRWGREEERVVSVLSKR